MTDQEGGLVRRLPGRRTCPRSRSARIRCRRRSPATQAGQGAAANLRGVGMNVNLAPVLDVYRQAGNFDDQFGRSYSKNPHCRVGSGRRLHQGAADRRGRGHGQALPRPRGRDGQSRTPTRAGDAERAAGQLRSTDESPYKAAIAAGVKLIMVSWAVYPALDHGPPGSRPTSSRASSAPARLHGVTITDALEAGALRSSARPRTAPLLAAQAGMDLLLCAAQNVTQGEQASGELAAAYRNGTLGARPSWPAEPDSTLRQSSDLIAASSSTRRTWSQPRLRPPGSATSGWSSPRASASDGQRGVLGRVVRVEVDEAALDLPVADLEDVAPPARRPLRYPSPPGAVLMLAMAGALADDDVAAGEDQLKFE